MTTPDIRPLVVGNWKMNGTRESLTEIKAIAEGAEQEGRELGSQGGAVGSGNEHCLTQDRFGFFEGRQAFLEP